MRGRFEDYLAESKGVPVVQLVVQGGPGAMKTAAVTAAKGHPIVIIIDAGGAGAAIHAYVTMGIEYVEDQFARMEEQLQTIKQANQEHHGRLLSFFSLVGLQSSGDINLSRRILEAIINLADAKSAEESADSGPATTRSEHTGDQQVVESGGRRPGKMAVKMLTLAINWDRIDIAISLLNRQEADSNSSFLVARALQRALELRRSKFVQLLLTLPTCTTTQIHLCPLYAALPAKVIDTDPMLKYRLQERIHDLYDSTKGDKFHYELYK
eukprot:1203144-Prymnesium_polylepis.1